MSRHATIDFQVEYVIVSSTVFWPRPYSQQFISRGCVVPFFPSDDFLLHSVTFHSSLLFSLSFSSPVKSSCGDGGTALGQTGKAPAANTLLVYLEARHCIWNIWNTVLLRSTLFIHGVCMLRECIWRVCTRAARKDNPNPNPNSHDHCLLSKLKCHTCVHTYLCN